MNKGDIFRVNLVGRGHEQKGFRPVIVYSRNVAGVVAVIPLTSVRNALKYEGSLEIFKSDLNGLGIDSIALTCQIKTIDARFLTSKLGKLDKKDLNLIDDKVKEFFELN